MYKDVNDYEQLYLIRENDEYALKIVYEKYRPIIVSIANRYNKYTDGRIEIDDFIQEGYIGLQKAIASYHENTGVLFYTFCIICIERQIKSLYRNFLTQKNYHFNHSCSLEWEIENTPLLEFITDPCISNDPDKALDALCFHDQVIQFKNELEPRDSAIFELRCNGFKYREIAILLDVPIGIIDSSIHYCKKCFTRSLYHM